jgi:hypothetical protein
LVGVADVGATFGKAGGTSNLMVPGVSPATKPEKRISLGSAMDTGGTIVTVAEMFAVAAFTDEAQAKVAVTIIARVLKEFSETRDVSDFIDLIPLCSFDAKRPITLGDAQVRGQMGKIIGEGVCLVQSCFGSHLTSAVNCFSSLCKADARSQACNSAALGLVWRSGTARSK